VAQNPSKGSVAPYGPSEGGHKVMYKLG